MSLSKAARRRELKKYAAFIQTYKISRGFKRDWEADQRERRLQRQREDAEAMKKAVECVFALAMSEQEAKQWKAHTAVRVSAAKALLAKYDKYNAWNLPDKTYRLLCQAYDAECLLSPYLDAAECGRKLSEAASIEQRQALLREMRLDSEQERFVEGCHHLNQSLPWLFPTMLKNRIHFRKAWLRRDEGFDQLRWLLTTAASNRVAPQTDKSSSKRAPDPACHSKHQSANPNKHNDEPPAHTGPVIYWFDDDVGFD